MYNATAKEQKADLLILAAFAAAFIFSSPSDVSQKVIGLVCFNVGFIFLRPRFCIMRYVPPVTVGFVIVFMVPLQHLALVFALPASKTRHGFSVFQIPIAATHQQL